MYVSIYIYICICIIFVFSDNAVFCKYSCLCSLCRVLLLA